MKNKTVAAWLAFAGGPLGLHRFYLAGFGDLLGWMLPIPTALGLYGVPRLQKLAAETDDPERKAELAITWGDDFGSPHETAVADMFDALIATMIDTRVEPDVEGLCWSLANLFHRAEFRIQRELDDSEDSQKRSQREQDGSEVKAVELERLIREGIGFIERRNAMEFMREAAADLDFEEAARLRDLLLTDKADMQGRYCSAHYQHALAKLLEQTPGLNFQGNIDSQFGLVFHQVGGRVGLKGKSQPIRQTKGVYLKYHVLGESKESGHIDRNRA